MNRAISRPLLDRLQADATVAGDREICGLLIGSADGIDDAIGIPNAAADPTTGFALDPRAQLAVTRASREAGRAIVGCYHSHPSGDRTPSRTDAVHADQQDYLWLILGGGGADLWRSRSGGPVLGAFEPVGLDIVGEPALQPHGARANRRGRTNTAAKGPDAQ